MTLSFSLLLFLGATKACLFGSNYPESKHCGEKCTVRWCDKNHEYRWHLYVVPEDPKQGIFDLPRICFGTIIASNLIITSMRCLIGDSDFEVFETWNSFSLLFLSNKSRVKIFPSVPINNKNSEDVNFQIEKIFFSQRYAVSKSVNSFNENDLAVIVLKGNLFSVKMNSIIRYRPVCFGEDGMDLTKLQLYTLLETSTEYTKYRPPPWNINKICVLNQTVDNATEISGENILEIAPGKVVPLNKCNKLLALKGNDAPDSNSLTTLCFRLHGEQRLLTGQPLLASSGTVTSDTTPNCLIGISTYGSGSTISKHSREDDGYNYAYFTNLLRKSNQAQFCNSESTNKDKGFSSESDVRITEMRYSWQKPDSDTTRNIALNCVCGLLRHGEPVGISLSFETRMGWITLVRVRRGLDATDCTGTVINDRYVIVAAHCLLRDTTLTITDLPPNDFVDVANIQVFLDVFNRTDLTAAKQKQVAKIRIHPGFGKHWIHDIAIVILEEPVEFAKCGKGRRPICLPEIETYEGHIAFGWRGYDINGDIRYWDFLNQEKYHTVFDCKNLTINGTKIQPDKKVCYHRSGDPKEDLNLPQGVSNEPVYAMSKSQQWTLLGTGSWRTEGINSVPQLDGSISKQFGSIGVYYNLNEMDAFVNYYANLDGARWCNERLATT